DLLQMLLRKRSPKHSALTVQSDLSTVNLVADETLNRYFTFRYAGCTSHARRPFALYEHEDPLCCGAMLHLFKGLFIHEHGLDIVGRNAENVQAVRGVDCRQLWQQIKELAQDMSERWSRETKLGEAARYITRNYDKLTVYLDDPRLSPTNNFSERMLRLEKLIENSSLFRATLEGRFALDIMRSVLQTAVAARAPLQPYLLAVLRASPDEVAANPERFTPRAWAAAHSGNPGEHAETLVAPLNATPSN
ncbi:MAG TPA: transposase, partial [Polyangiales bacterium]